MNPQLHGLLVNEKLHTPMIMNGQYPQLSMDFFERVSQIHKLKLRNSPNPQSRVLSDKLLLSQLFKTFSTIYGTTILLTFITTARHFYPPCGRLMNTTSAYLISVRPILISSSHVHLGHPNCFSSACFATKVSTPLHTPLYTFQFMLLSFFLQMAGTNARKKVVQDK